MAAVVGITLIKKLAYRGDASEEVSNQYWFTGAVPASDAAWKALTDALIVEERKVYVSDVAVIRAYGYNDDAETAVAVWSWDYEAAAATVSGQLTITGGQVCPGDSAMWVRWKTSKLNTKGRNVYLRKYFHPAVNAGASTAGRDQVLPAAKTALAAFGTKLSDGSFLDARTIRGRTFTPTILSVTASPYVTTRTLKRRGKRPGS